MRKSGWLVCVGLVGLLAVTGAQGFVIGFDMEQMVPANDSNGTSAFANILNPADLGYNAGRPNNGAAQSTSQSRFGTHSLYVSGSANVNAYENSDLSPTGDHGRMTIMAYIYLPDTAGAHTLIGNNFYYEGQGRYWFYTYNSSAYFQYYDSGANVWNVVAAYGAITANTWIHLAVTFDHGTVTLYVNGSPAGTQTFASGTTIPSNTTYTTLGIRQEVDSLAGYMDDFYFNSEATLSAQEVAYYTQYSVATPPVTVTGKVVLGNYSDLSYAGVRVEFLKGGVVKGTFNTLLDTAGNFSVPNVPQDTFDVAVKACGWLRQVKASQPIGTGATDVGTFTLVGGDLNGNGGVDSTDLSIVLANMDQ